MKRVPRAEKREETADGRTGRKRETASLCVR